ncbi:MAG: hypothetical protein AB7I37_22260 [Pirellulales bacterium]
MKAKDRKQHANHTVFLYAEEAARGSILGEDSSDVALAEVADS